MPRAHHAEVPPVDCRNLRLTEAFGCCDDGGIDGAERQVVVLRDQLDHPESVSGVHWFECESAVGEVTQKAGFGLPAEPRAEQIGDLGDDERGNDQRTRMRLEQFEARGMMRIIGVDVRIERAGVDDQRDDADSARMISSTRSEMSLRPLRPAAAAPSRRREPPAPRCASSAVRVISAMVVPRRCASCRSRASRSSGSFTVVRTMGMPAYHPCVAGVATGESHEQRSTLRADPGVEVAIVISTNQFCLWGN